MGRRTHDGLCDTRAFSITDGRDGDGPTGPGRTTELNSVRRPGRRSPRDPVRTAETKSFGASAETVRAKSVYAVPAGY